MIHVYKALATCFKGFLINLCDNILTIVNFFKMIGDFIVSVFMY
jgi:hypothetical protein